jgi:NAD(P)-dependent dehydrogenase (short-subunit alcohol dehydrogenase family)
VPPATASVPAERLDGQVALVTGAGRGLGRAMAEHLARAGAAVALAARSDAELATVAEAIRARGGRALVVPVDVTDADAVEWAVATVEQALGPITLLVNNAGHGGVPGPVWAVDAAQWWQTFEVNLRGAFLCTRAVLARLVARGGPDGGGDGRVVGRVVNVSSRAGNAAIAHASAYATSKAALTRLTEIVAAEAAAHGVRAFAIEPGQVRTAMTEALMTGEAGRTWLPWYRETFDAGRDAPPDDAAPSSCAWRAATPTR